MRYLIINNKDKVFNLSSSNVNNLNAYSAKFDGKTPAIANFLEMTGSATLVNANKGIGFPNQ